MSDEQPTPPQDKVGPGNPPKDYRWKPGQSGNPGGRPKGRSITARLRALLEQEHGGKQLADLVAERFLKDVLQGKLGHLKEMLDRLEGPVPSKTEVSGEGGSSLVFHIVEAKPPNA